jgi:CRISPR/Cas system-associated exonuclease Cas4 (RecB family)
LNTITIPKVDDFKPGVLLPRISATDYADYSYCPRRYYYAKVLGLRGYERHTGEEEKGPSSMEKGSKLHALLEVYDFVKKELPGSVRLTEEQKKDLLPLVEGIAGSEIGRMIASTAPDGQKREYEFSTRIDGVQCIARIDLALRLSEKEWSIIDYKSGKKTDWSLELYKNQVSYYAALFSHANKIDVTRCAIVYAEASMSPPVWFEPSSTIANIKEAISQIEVGEFKPTIDKRCFGCPYSGSAGGRWVCKFGWNFVKGRVKRRKRSKSK